MNKKILKFSATLVLAFSLLLIISPMFYANAATTTARAHSINIIIDDYESIVNNVKWYWVKDSNYSGKDDINALVEGVKPSGTGPDWTQDPVKKDGTSFHFSGDVRGYTPFIYIDVKQRAGWTYAGVQAIEEGETEASALSFVPYGNGYVVDVGCYKGDWASIPNISDRPLRNANSTVILQTITYRNEYKITVNGNGGTVKWAGDYSLYNGENAFYECYDLAFMYKGPTGENRSADWSDTDDTDYMPFYAEREGYIFNGFYDAPSGGNCILKNYEVQVPNDKYLSNTTIYAQWTPMPTYTIQFNANGGTGSVPSTITKTGTGSNTTMGDIGSQVPTRPGYTFRGWSASSSYSNKRIAYSSNYGGGTDRSGVSATTTSSSWSIATYISNTGGDHSNKTLTLYAQWEPNQYTVAYNANGGTGTMSNSIATYNSNFITRQNAFSRVGYTFNGWNEYADGTHPEQWGLTNSGVYESGKYWKWAYAKSITLYAQWKPNIYTITLNNQSATSAGTTGYYEKYNTGNYKEVGCSNVITSITIPQKTGYKFLGYYTGTNGSGTQYIDANGQILATSTAFTSNTTLYAKWEITTATLYYNVNGGQVTVDKGYIVDNDGFLTLKDNNGNYVKAWKKVLYNDANVVDVHNMYDTFGVTKLGYHLVTGKEYLVGSKTSATTIGHDSAALSVFQAYIKNQDADINLFANWEANSYYIKYDSNKPSIATSAIKGTMSDSLHIYDTAKNLTSNIYTLTGWTFSGWNTKADGTGVSYADNQAVKNLTTINEDTIILYAQWKDITAPAVTITATPNNWTNTNVTITASANDLGSGLKNNTLVITNGAGVEVARGTDSVTYIDTSEGKETYKAVVYDNSGNANQATCVSYIDFTAPTITNVQNVYGWTNQDVTINANIGDTGGSELQNYVIKDANNTTIQSGTFSGNSGNVTITFTDEQNATYVLTVADNAGNKHKVAFTVKIDKVNPTITIKATPNSWTNGSVTITATASDNLSGVKTNSLIIYNEAGQTVSIGTSSASFVDTSAGKEKYTAVVYDNTGNRSEVYVYSYIDYTPPVISNLKELYTWENKDITVTANITDAGGSGLKNYILKDANGTTIISGTISTNADEVIHTFKTEQDMEYTLTVWDNAGNSSYFKFKIEIDKTTPGIIWPDPIPIPPDGPTSDPEADPPFTLEDALEYGWFKEDTKLSFSIKEVGDFNSGIKSVTLTDLVTSEDLSNGLEIVKNNNNDWDVSYTFNIERRETYCLTVIDNANSVLNLYLVVKIDKTAPKAILSASLNKETDFAAGGWNPALSIYDKAIYGKSYDNMITVTNQGYGQPENVSGLKTFKIYIARDYNENEGFTSEYVQIHDYDASKTVEIEPGNYTDIYKEVFEKIYNLDALKHIGSLRVIAIAEDFAGNITITKTEPYDNFIINGYIDRAYVSSSPEIMEGNQFFAGEKGLIYIDTLGYVEDVEIIFDAKLEKWLAWQKENMNSDVVAELKDMQLSSKFAVNPKAYEELKFIKRAFPRTTLNVYSDISPDAMLGYDFHIPFYASKGRYNITLRAYKDGAYADYNLDVIVGPSIIKFFRTRIRIPSVLIDVDKEISNR